jgi:predicted metal-dependent HD superfamily phosphohydrolase
MTDEVFSTSWDTDQLRNDTWTLSATVRTADIDWELSPPRGQEDRISQTFWGFFNDGIPFKGLSDSDGESDALVDQVRTAIVSRLEAAAASGNDEAQALLRCSEGMTERSQRLNPAALARLHLAADRGHDIARLAVELERGLDGADDQGVTPLMVAAELGRTQEARRLIERGARLEATTRTGWTALCYALARGHIALAKWLHGHGALLPPPGALREVIEEGMKASEQKVRGWIVDDAPELLSLVPWPAPPRNWSQSPPSPLVPQLDWRMEVIFCCPRCGSERVHEDEDVPPLPSLERWSCDQCGYSQIVSFDDPTEWKQVRHLPVEGSRFRAARFGALWRGLGSTDDGSAVFERLRAAYDEPHRAYHTRNHILACLEMLDEPSVQACAWEPLEVEAALWFHDAVYDPHAQDNEEKSAALAHETMRDAGVAHDVAARVAEMIRGTRGHAPTPSAGPDGALVIDIDLSILGAAPDVFARFEEQIRREYQWVDEATFRAGRRAVLARFLSRTEIYRTPLLRDRFEVQARQNLQRAIDAPRSAP